MKKLALKHPKTLEEILALAAEENLILRTTDGRTFVVAEIDDFEDEIRSVRDNQELWDLLQERGRPSRTLSLEEVKAALKLD